MARIYFYKENARFQLKKAALVAGGFNILLGSPLASSELYDPASGTWTATDSLNTARASHTATLLPNGKVLVAGGENNNTGVYVCPTNTEGFDPASGSRLSAYGSRWIKQSIEQALADCRPGGEIPAARATSLIVVGLPAPVITVPLVFAMSLINPG